MKKFIVIALSVMMVLLCKACLPKPEQTTKEKSQNNERVSQEPMQPIDPPSTSGQETNLKPVSSHLQAYLSKYVTDFSPKAAFLDLGKSKTPLISELFGEDNQVIKDLTFSMRDPNTALREYLAGQVLTALGFPTSRTCFYIDTTGKQQALYQSVPSLAKNVVDNCQDLHKFDQTNGGFNIDKNVYWQTLPQYYLFPLSKWLVGETDYNNQDFFAFLLPEGHLSMFVFDFEHAGAENRDLTKVIDGLLASIYEKGGGLKNKFLTKEQIYAFITQLKDLIKEGTEINSSVLASIFYNDRVDAVSFLARDTLYGAIKQQITMLIDYIENIHKNDLEYKGFSDREAIRTNIIEKVAKAIRIDKRLFRLSLMGPYYLNNPSDIDELKNLNSKIDSLIKKENNRVMASNNYVPSYEEKTEAFFSYPKNKDFYVMHAGDNSKMEAPLIEYLKKHHGHLNLKGEIKFAGNINWENDVKKIIQEKASLVVVGVYFEGMSATGLAFSALPSIQEIYEQQNAEELPKYAVHVQTQRKSPLHYGPGFKVLYKGKDGKSVTQDIIQKGFMNIGVFIDNNDKLLDKQYLDGLISHMERVSS
jgi:hypothetical protein